MGGPEDWSAIVEKVDSIEAQVKQKSQFVFSTVFDGDECDWQNTATSLDDVEIEDDQLTPDEAKAKAFAAHQAELIASHWSLPVVEIVVVSDLLAAANNGNAFQRSYVYSAALNSLCVRRERLADVGLLGMIVLHGMAHIQVCNFSDDTNKEFLQSFYDGLRVLSKQLFTQK